MLQAAAVPEATDSKLQCRRQGDGAMWPVRESGTGSNRKGQKQGTARLGIAMPTKHPAIQ